MKYRNRKRNKNIIITLILISLLIIGYSLISTNFNIGGVFTLEPVVYDVHYDEGITYNDDNTAEGEVTLDSAKTTVSTSATFNNPGDKYGFTIPIVNEGTEDSMLDIIAVSGLTAAQQQYIKVSYEYSDEIEPTQYDLLKAGEAEYLRINIMYDVDSLENEELPTNGDKIELKINIQYLQSDSNAQERIKYLFGRNEDSVYISQAIPSGVTLSNNYNSLLGIDNRYYFIKYKMYQDIVQEMYIGFKYNNNMYYLKGLIDEHEQTNKPVYNNNKSILDNTLGSTNCTVETDVTIEYYACDNGTFSIRVYNDGKVDITNPMGSSYYCGIYDNNGNCDYVTS